MNTQLGGRLSLAPIETEPSLERQEPRVYGAAAAKVIRGTGFGPPLPPRERGVPWRPHPGTNKLGLPIFALVCCLPIHCAFGQPGLATLHPFGFTNFAAANPCAELTAGSDGALYGTTSAGGAAGKGTVFAIAPDGSAFRVLKAFGSTSNDAALPLAAVIEASDGLLYGTTDEGGDFGYGAVFRLGKDGSNFTILKSFTNGDGAYPEGRLIEASDGLLYGTTSGGGTNDFGVIFRLGKDGSGFLPLMQFGGTNGANPEGGLIEASDGLLYGATYSGGATIMGATTNLGTVFRLSKDGSGFAVLHRFTNSPFLGANLQTNGLGPYGRLVEGTNGVLYGATSAGGTNGNGTLFSLNKDGTGFRALRSFARSATSDGRIPLCEMILASDGLLYGTTYDGGTNGNGTAFRIGQDGSNYVELASVGLAQGPASALLEAPDGTLYGTTQLGGDSGDGTIFKVQKDGTGFGIVRSFGATGGDGQSSYGGLASASDGLLYGSTRLGGTQGAGTLFSLRFDGQGYGLVANFASSNAGPYGPLAAVVVGASGLLYGDTQFGGVAANGTIFSVQKDGGNFNVIYSPPSAANGQEPRGSLVQASDGAFYGTTTLGGASGQGTLFRLSADATSYTILTNFAPGINGPGANPMQALIEGSDHALYGATYTGGPTNNGTIFKINKDSSGFAILKSFGLPPDGANPMSPLLEASDGALYGTTFGGGTTNNAGTVFRINKDGTGYQILQSFVGTAGDARHPSGALVEGGDGALYGTTERGGANDLGTVFTLHKDGSNYVILASFGGALGQYPRGGLVIGRDGALYGTTDQGGDMGFGTTFRFGAPIEEISAFQLLGGYASLTCLGLPGTNYWIERTATLGPSANWLSIASTNAAANGQFVVLDQSPPPAGAYYRMRR